MSEEWQHQVRIDLDGPAAELARRDASASELPPLAAILARHQATVICQFDAFAGYVAEAEREGAEHYSLYDWTKSTIEDPVKKAKYLKSFTLYVEGQQVYPRARAEALAAELQLLVDKGMIARIAQYDTNPANNPQPPARPA